MTSEDTRKPNRARLLVELAQLAEELCDPHQHVEPIREYDKHRNRRVRRAYVTTQPGLLAQLGEAMVDASSSNGGAAAHSVPGSRPPGSWEALATHAAITVGVARWCWDLRLPMRDTVEANIRLLVGGHPSLDDERFAQLLADVRRWRHKAAVMTGWQLPLFAPRVPCPVCDKPNALRINLDRQVAVCTNPERDERDELVCGATWDAATIGVLAEYIRRYATPLQRV